MYSPCPRSLCGRLVRQLRRRSHDRTADLAWGGQQRSCPVFLPAFLGTACSGRAEVKIQTGARMRCSADCTTTFCSQMCATFPCRYRSLVPELACHKCFFAGVCAAFGGSGNQYTTRPDRQRSKFLLLRSGLGKNGADHCRRPLRTARVAQQLDRFCFQEGNRPAQARVPRVKSPTRFRIGPAVYRR